MRLVGKVALITGGTSGIGRATALLFAREGAKVAITGRDEARGQEVVADIEQAGGAAIFVRSDVRLADDCRRAVEETLHAFGRLDILFNNAGVFYPHDAAQLHRGGVGSDHRYLSKGHVSDVQDTPCR